LANEAVNRCGPLMLVQLARTHTVKESDVVIAWAQAWAALNLAPLFATLDAHALKVPVEVSKALDQRTRALQHAVIQGVLSLPENASNEPVSFGELTSLFSQPDTVRHLVPASTLSVGSKVQDSPEFAHACQAVDAIEGMADFLFAALTITRPQDITLPTFLQLGMALRRQAGIDGLERVLMHAPINLAQEGLRSHALQALRRTQQRLLSQVLCKAEGKADKADDAVASVIEQLKIGSAAVDQQGVEQAVLSVWALSEAAL